ncbi:hypothetical protein BSQ98_25755 [Serratia liquefaciens]|uniref:hypothetical protein n=1 Tax=Serratia liquefaciens TaxID=614 RepID=UPI00101EC3B8|nr:hypothetical protein [Serratia liquefaciens]RYM57482.1 hypothetical protein BSQ98_25755 [Serratia liquefaciens]
MKAFLNKSDRASRSDVIDVENDSLSEAIAKKITNTSISNETYYKFQKIVGRRIVSPGFRADVINATQLLDKFSNPTVKASIAEILHPLTVIVGEKMPIFFEKNRYDGTSYTDRFTQFLRTPEGIRHQKEVDVGISALRAWAEKWAGEKGLSKRIISHRANALNHLRGGLLGQPRENDPLTLRHFVEDGKASFFKNLSALYDKDLDEDIIHPLLDSTLSELDVCDPGMLIALQGTSDYITQLQNGKNIFAQLVSQREGLLVTLVSAYVKNLYNTGILEMPLNAYNGYEKHFVAAFRWAAARKLDNLLGLSPSLKALGDPYARTIIDNQQAWRGNIPFDKCVDDLVKKLKNELLIFQSDWIFQQVDSGFSIINDEMIKVARKNKADIIRQEIPEDLVFNEFYEGYKKVTENLILQGWGSEYIPKMNDIFHQQKDERYFYSSDKVFVLIGVLQQLIDKKIYDILSVVSSKMTGYLKCDMDDKERFFYYTEKKIYILYPDLLNKLFYLIKNGNDVKLKLLEEAELLSDPSDEDQLEILKSLRDSLLL